MQQAALQLQSARMLVDCVDGMCHLQHAALHAESGSSWSGSTSYDEARPQLAAWRDDCNRVRPHSAFPNQTQEEFRFGISVCQSVAVDVRLSANGKSAAVRPHVARTL